MAFSEGTHSSIWTLSELWFSFFNYIVEMETQILVVISSVCNS